MKFLIVVLFTFISMKQNVWAQMPVFESKIKAVYGFSKRLTYFENRSNNEILQELLALHVNAVFGGYEDSNFVNLLHEKGLKVFAEVPFFVGEKWWQSYPQSRPVQADGSLLEKEKWYAGVNPTCKDILVNRLQKIDELIAKKVDGIWLDFFRWPCFWEPRHPKLIQTSFDEQTVQLFLEEKNLEIPRFISENKAVNNWILENHYEKWCEFKNDVIVELAREVNTHIKDKNESIILGLFIVPWQENEFGGAIKSIVGQDIFRLAKHIDVFSPMVYHGINSRQVDWVQSTTEYMYFITKKSIVPIIQSMNEPRIISETEFSKALHFGLASLGSCGVIVFNLKGMDDSKLNVLKDIFSDF